MSASGPPLGSAKTSPQNMTRYGRGSCRWARTIARRALEELDSVKLSALRASADYYHSQTLYDKTKFQATLYACRLVAALLRFQGRWTVDMEWEWKMLPELVDHVRECHRGGLLDSIAQGVIQDGAADDAEAVLNRGIEMGVLPMNNPRSLAASEDVTVLLLTWARASMSARRVLDSLKDAPPKEAESVEVNSP